MTLHPEEKQQYDRHIILDEIGLSGQEKLKQARVLVIGAGGLGCPILQYLTASGVGTIGIVDNDVVSQSNLQRQVLYTHNDIGKFKAEIAAERLSGLNPFVNFKVDTNRLLTKNALNLFNLYDIIIDGSDNFATRYLVNDAAVLTNKPVVFLDLFLNLKVRCLFTITKTDQRIAVYTPHLQKLIRFLTVPKLGF